jgi:exodeoxyribonuclease VII large subunit
MPRKPQSQWNFGELFAEEKEEDTRTIHSVSEITSRIKTLLNRQIGEVWISGEVTNLRKQSSGHLYFSLKDAGAQINCALFRNQHVAHREYLEDGQKVLINGDVTVYEARGNYQLIVSGIELQGVGALQLKFEKLKQKLSDEGLFDPESKLPIPPYPERIGLVTSPTAAALQDVIHVLERRHPGLEIILASCRVQGDEAAREIARQIAALNRLHETVPLDLILVTRGGGSMEDLWAFNEEIVARAIHASKLPVVSAVGHEIDFTIADFVADLRAATPSAAAEQISEGIVASRQFFIGAQARLQQLLRNAVVQRSQLLAQTKHRLSLSHPRRRLNEFSQRLDDLTDDLNHSATTRIAAAKQGVQNLNQRLSAFRLRQAVRIRRQELSGVTRRFNDAATRSLQTHRTRLTDLTTRLQLLSPQAILDRGYSITTQADTGNIVRQTSDAPTGTVLNTRLPDGEVTSTVG